MKKKSEPHAQDALRCADPKLLRQVIDFLDCQQTPVSAEEIANHTGISMLVLEKELFCLVHDGEAIVTRKGGYALPERLGYLRGNVQGTRRGDLWFLPDGGAKDSPIPADATAGALHGDRVLAHKDSATSIRVTRILRRANEEIVGTLQRVDAQYLFAPDDMRLPADIVVDVSQSSAKVGDKIILQITRWPDEGGLRGRVQEVLGNSNDPNVGLRAIVRQYHLQEAFSAPALEEAKKASEQPIVAEDRLDLRETVLFTIDGADAKDFDDAVSLCTLPDGTQQLGVHIADVSAYVQEDNVLDVEAYTRGTSVYLPGFTLPMLPEALSNGACSLQPHVERLAFSILMDVDAAGHVVRYALHKTLIRSCARLVYEQVNAALAGDPAQAEHHAALLPVLRQMEEISRKLRARRHARGSIDFDLEESAITLDAQGEPASVAPRLRGIAECMIEDFMLTANETVAAYARAMEIPFLYRVHEEPDGDRLEEFSTFLSNLGLRIRGARNGVQPQMLQQVLTQAADRPEAPVVSKLMLRAMKKARYAPQPLGHFGLAAQDYCHFTSPIRRYPDLCIHRILSMVISGKMDEKQQERLQKRVQETAEETSRSERNAMDAERAADSLMKARYMRQFIGEEYTGVISGVQAWGFYVALPSTVEGLVHVRTLSDYFTYDAAQYCLVGARSRRIFRIGDPVRVRVEGVDLAERLVQFTYLSSKV